MTMPNLAERDAELLSKEWAALQEALVPPARVALAALVAEQAAELVERFYAELEKDADAREFLSQDLIRDRLSGALQRWLLALFPAETVPDFDEMARVQCHAGAVHARIGLPLKLVTRGLRLMTEGLIHAIVAQEDLRQSRRAMLRVAASTLSIAIDIMNSATVGESRRSEQNAGAFRLFTLGKNLSQEREAQRAAMAEWLQEAMFIIAARERLEDLPDLRSSEFGLWLTHRGDVLFEGTHEIHRAQALVARIDADLLPGIRRGEDLRNLLERLNSAAAEVRALVLQCFNEATRIEGGHDALTGVLSRRFMDTILAREVETARRQRQDFAVALIDLDHFKRINDLYGHSAGDLALRRCAEAILETARVGDYVFRYGGEEFLVTLAEMDPEAAQAFGERLLEALRSRDIHLPGGEVIRLTASIGIAAYNGEPDFHRLTMAADQALYEAKSLGRNRVHLAS
ncbi:diguanylate cyclase [Falsigemmobacter intermedius]|nr:GGDEF domain-containing protein [Falsigemmobacter intermedius]